MKTPTNNKIICRMETPTNNKIIGRMETIGKSVIKLIYNYLPTSYFSDAYCFRLCSKYISSVVSPLYFSNYFSRNKIDMYDIKYYGKHKFRSFVNKYKLKISVRNVNSYSDLSYLNTYDVKVIEMTFRLKCLGKCPAIFYCWNSRYWWCTCNNLFTKYLLPINSKHYAIRFWIPAPKQIAVDFKKLVKSNPEKYEKRYKLIRNQNLSFPIIKNAVLMNVYNVLNMYPTTYPIQIALNKREIFYWIISKKFVFVFVLKRNELNFVILVNLFKLLIKNTKILTEEESSRLKFLNETTLSTKC